VRRAGVTTEIVATNGFLFCDLRGYTAFVERHGDQAAAELLATYRSLVRSAIAAHTGAEIKTEGDSVYVVFPAASAAVEAGLEIVAAAAEASTRERPIRVGVGIHAGETVATTEGLVGGAVNIAARVCAKAQAGEVLVTDTVRALTRTFLPYTYTSLGTQTLKGIAGGIPLYRVEAVSTGRLAHLRRRVAARRRRVALVAFALVAVFVAGSTAWVATRPVPCLALDSTTHDVVAKVDPSRGCVVATYPVGRGSSLAVWVKDKLWVANADDGTISVLSATGTPVATVGIGGNITAMAADGTDMWVLDAESGIITKATLDSASTTGRYLLPTEGEIVPASAVSEVKGGLDAASFARWFGRRQGEYFGLAADSGRLWISNSETGELVGMHGLSGRGPVFSATGDDGSSPRTFQVDGMGDRLVEYCWEVGPGVMGCPDTPGPPTPYTGPLAVVGRAVWAGHRDAPDLAVVDTDTGIVNHVTPTGAVGGTSGLAVIDGNLWVAFHGGQVARIRPGPQMAVSQVAPAGATVGVEPLAGIAGDASGVWVASPDHHTVTRLDPASLDVAGRIDVGGKASAVAMAPDGSVWVTVR
jgi:class 3 adenylate cyclase